MVNTPYSELKKDEKAYEIMLLIDQNEKTFAEIAKKYQISTQRVRQLYKRIKIRQIRIYINHILSLGYENNIEIKQNCYDAINFYQNHKYISAYLEKEYKEILDKYRCKEPGMPEKFIKKLPVCRKSLSKKTIGKIIKMKEEKNMNFAEIGKELRITREKARDVYSSFYHKKVMELIRIKQESAKTQKEKDEIWENYFGKNWSSRKRYEKLMEGEKEKP